MSQTEHCGLRLFEVEDPIRREDVNTILGQLDAALGGIDAAQVGAYTKAQCISAGTRAILELGSTATPNVAFQRLAVGLGNHGLLIHLRLADGTPLPGATIAGLTNLHGGSAVTNANGDVAGIISTNTYPATISVSSIWVDVNDGSITVPTPPSLETPILELTITLTPKPVNSVIQITSSKTVKFAKTHSATVCCVGGGSGGNSGFGYYTGDTTMRQGGYGGAGGKIINSDITVTAGNHKVTVGAGGAGGVGEPTYSNNGSAGGATLFDDITSDLGSSGTLPLNDSSMNIGGSGGRGGDSYTSSSGRVGSNGTRAGGGGGGGYGGNGTHGSGGTSPGGSSGSSGTSSKGGKGGDGGTGGGGGGGGGCRPNSSGSTGGNGGKGGNGIVLIKLLS